jgi:hypothetical protein
MYVLANGQEIIEYPYSLRKLKQDNPNVSFPSHFSEELLASYGVYFVNSESAPEFDDHTHNCISDSAPTYTNGSWILGCSVVEKSQEEKDENIKQYASMVREQRNELLYKSDWTQLADANLTESQRQIFVVYRQALRDITEQDGFPMSVEWPSHAG